MIRLDAATFLLQWAVGGLAFLWVTTRRREVGVGYGWLLRGVYGLMAIAAVVVGLAVDPVPVREGAGVAVVVTTGVSFGVSIARRRAGVSGEQELSARRRQRISEMTGIERTVDADREPIGPEHPPWLDAVPPLLGTVGLVAAGIDAGSPVWLSVLRTIVGAAFLGAVTDAMLLGHWYLVQPGLARGPLLELVRYAGAVWPVEVLVLLLPTGMVSVLNGSIDDEYGGILGWMWVACAITTAVLLVVTRAALRERQYSAVMAATGLLYLAILTAFGTDLVARAVLA